MLFKNLIIFLALTQPFYIVYILYYIVISFRTTSVSLLTKNVRLEIRHTYCWQIFQFVSSDEAIAIDFEAKREESHYAGK